jgi:23S rRNA (cytosine1962-C5)-methyltransferase
VVAGDVVVSRKGAARVLRGHPWVFRSDVADARGVPGGSVVRVLGPGERPLGHAFFSSRSEIRLRMIARGEALPEGFLRDRLAAALTWRRTVAADAEACRLVHGEGDGLPSLVVDRYADVLVVQTLSQATEALKDEIVRLLVELVRPRGILERNDPKVRALEGLPSRVGLVHGEVPERVEVREGGLRLAVDPWRGQKTGLFLDQRENHLMARGYARGRVLDAFAYHGGFGLHAAALASEVLAVDTSAEAVAAIAADARRNGLANVVAREANAFDLLRQLDASGERFDTVVLDPPAFAKSRDAVPKAVRGYKEINLRALRLLAPGGCLITCSCSYHVHEADFESILAAAAADAGASVTIVEKRRQARDHPVLLGVPETYYLKCFALRKLPPS